MTSTAVAPLAPPEPYSLQPVEPCWSLGRRVAFRFVFVTTLTLLGPFPLTVIKELHWANWPFDKVLLRPAYWCAQLLGGWLLHYHGPVDLPPDGSGDRTVDWAVTFGALLFGLVVTAVWSLIDRRRLHYRRLETFVRVLARYWVAFNMFNYGFEKIFVAQMPMPALLRLEQPFGDLTPMNVLWNFMGASPAYERFAGAMEVVAGLLLAWRRTSLLGALAAAGVMLNVFMMNLCYDVPVKLYSLGLLVTALALAAYDAPRLLPVLLRRSVPPVSPSLQSSPRRRRTLAALEVVLALALVGFGVRDSVRYVRRSSPDWPIEGRWRVQRQVLDGRELPPLTTEDARWRTVLVSHYRRWRFVVVTRNDERRTMQAAELDDKKHTLTLTADDGEPARTLTMTTPDADHLVLRDADGRFVLELSRLPARPYILQTRGFHWINEEPFNR